VTEAEFILALDAKQNVLIAGNNILIDEITNTISSIGEVTEAELILALDAKQNVLIAGTNITIDENNIISSSGGITQSQLDTKQTILTAGNNITIGENNIISSSGGGSITEVDLDLKQDKLTAGTNITIDVDNNISSSGITQSQLDTKQNTLIPTSNITTGTISSGNITGRTSTTITAPTISSSGSLFYGNSINVGSKIATIESNLNTKQNTLIPTSNITTGTISSGNITGRTSSTISAPTITASSALLYGSTNVATKIGELETSLNGKQPTLVAGNNITISNNTISATGGTDLNSTSNITTGTISSGTITGRTGETISAPNITAGTNLLYGSTNVGTKIGQLETSLNGKQSTLVAGNNITISNNTISATGGTDLNSTSNIITGTIDSGNITGRTGTTINAPTIKASSNLLYGNNINVATKIGSIETTLNGKQNTLTFTSDLVINSMVVKPGVSKEIIFQPYLENLKQLL
jgi:hypothetical protein